MVIFQCHKTARAGLNGLANLAGCVRRSSSRLLEITKPRNVCACQYYLSGFVKSVRYDIVGNNNNCLIVI